MCRMDEVSPDHGGSRAADVRPFVQAFFLGLYALVLFLALPWLWLLLFFLGLLLSIPLCRFYCGWICPAHTVFRLINHLYLRLGIERRPAPRIERPNLVGGVRIAIFISALVSVLVLRVPFPILLVIMVAGVIITLFFEERFFHRYLCPFGIIFALVARCPRVRMHVDRERCEGCGLCHRECLNHAISLEGGVASIDSRECLMCLRCQQVCPNDAISYTAHENRP